MLAVLHPLFVHFPVALLITGVLAILWHYFRPEKSGPNLYAFTSGALGLGYAGLVMTVATGLYDLQASPKGQARDGWVILTVIHLACGVLLLVVYGFIIYRRFFPPAPTSPKSSGESHQQSPAITRETRPDRITLALAIAGLILLVITAYLGGMLVYEYRVGIQ